MDTKIKSLLLEGRVDGFWGYRTMNGFPFPRLFTEENANELEPWRPTVARYPVLKLLLREMRMHSDRTYGVLVRGCEERGLRELFKWKQLEPDKVVVVGQACSRELADRCECRKPFPDLLDYGDPAAPVTRSRKVEALQAMAMRERRGWWLTHMNRCIHCHGCRDVCPVCFCTECSLEHRELVSGTKLPPDSSFHLVRAVHMGGRCIDCGLCEEICPARIPLRSLYKEVNRLVEEIFDYRPGVDEGMSPFTFPGDELLLPTG
ncbi:MAG TPA: 4Fe-4S dicluster domain-containing protein [Syntrophobacter fumaroxidans]|nr:4Fe-4S dicluster domain-containing protein [Syntrophobacter fumaroxidans]